ncbi:mitochondrial carrier domain-containing protein, partial [Leptodontidium sp. 2 PMI_412]
LTGLQLYSRYAFAGAICCSVSHGILTPVDVIKTRIQLDPATYNSGLIGTFRQVIAKEGAQGLLSGLGPIVVGYFLQGALRFGGYEFFKKKRASVGLGMRLHQIIALPFTLLQLPLLSSLAILPYAHLRPPAFVWLLSPPESHIGRSRSDFQARH